MDKIRYSQCWEDTTVLMNALVPTKEDIILSICSGGCNSLAMMAEEPEKMIVIDNNPAQNHLFILKLCAFKYLNYETALSFLGYKHNEKRLLIYAELKKHLPSPTLNYWDMHKESIEKGIIHCGKFEQYLRIFRKYVLPLIHSPKTISELIEKKDEVRLKEFYYKKWQNKRWYWLFMIFFGEKMMKLLGRHKVMFTYNPHFNPGKTYLERTETFFTSKSLHNNIYLHYILYGTYKQYPLFISPEKITAINNYTSYEIITDTILDYLKTQKDNSISKFNLSDIFEPLSEKVSHELFAEIIRTAKPNARVLFWNNLVERTPPLHLKSYFTYDFEAMQKCNAINDIFFYDKLFILTINK